MNLLDLPQFRDRMLPISVEAYHRSVETGELDRCELLRGFIVGKKSKSPLHRLIVRQFATALRQYCAGQALLVFKEDPLTFADSEPEPDLAVVAGEERDYEELHPSTAELVIEVAISSLAVDRAKAEIYAEAGTPEFWIVMPKGRQIEVYREPVEGAYRDVQLIPGDTPLASSTLPGFELTLSDLLPQG